MSRVWVWYGRAAFQQPQLGKSRVLQWFIFVCKLFSNPLKTVIIKEIKTTDYLIFALMQKKIVGGVRGV